MSSAGRVMFTVIDVGVPSGTIMSDLTESDKATGCIGGCGLLVPLLPPQKIVGTVTELRHSKNRANFK